MLSALLRRVAREHAGGPGVEDDDGRRRTLGELIANGERLANALDDLGVPRGAPVGVLSENRAEYPEVDVGLVLARRVRVALNARLHLDDFRRAAEDCGMRALIHSARHADDAAALAEECGLTTISLDDDGPRGYAGLLAAAPTTPRKRAGDEEDPAWISYTSGTTGRPKGVVLSRRAILAVTVNLIAELGRPEPGEQVVLAQPLSHGAGYFVLPYLVCGAGLWVMDRYDPERVLELSRQPSIRTFKAVPAMLGPLLEAAENAPSELESIIYGASPIATPLLDASVERFGPVLVQIYGQSEAPMTLTCLHKADHTLPDERRTSAGRPWRTVLVEVRDGDGRPCPPGETGEVLVRGAHHMTGYHGMPAATADVMRDGWIHTRDAGVIDEHGFVHLRGRMDEMIVTGGFNVSPREVEQVIAEHPDVADCVVAGMPDERWGTAIVAVLTAHDGAAPRDAEIVEFARPRLGFRTPKRIVLVDSIARNAYGKVDRAALQAQLDATAGGERVGA